MVTLHPQLEKDCAILGEFTLCSLLLINNAHYPWFILLPNREGITELHHLRPQDQEQLLKESMYFSQCLEDIFQPDKLNIATLGNVVPQLHVHHIARFKSDICWPAPVWGAVTALPYTAEQSSVIERQLRLWFDKNTEQNFHWV